MQRDMHLQTSLFFFKALIVIPFKCRYFSCHRSCRMDNKKFLQVRSCPLENLRMKHIEVVFFFFFFNMNFPFLNGFLCSCLASLRYFAIRDLLVVHESQLHIKSSYRYYEIKISYLAPTASSWSNFFGSSMVYTNRTSEFFIFSYVNLKK